MTATLRDPFPVKPTDPPPPPFSKALLEALFLLRDGDFSVRLPNDLVGIDGKIADVFNDIAAVSERRARETARVSHAVGKEGKLKQRMAVPGAIGGWADEVAAVNTLIDDLVWPTTEVSRALAAVNAALACGMGKEGTRMTVSPGIAWRSRLEARIEKGGDEAGLFPDEDDHERPTEPL